MSTSVTTPKRQGTLEDRVAELIFRFEAGHFDEKVRDRLAEIFRDAPADSWARLERACDYLEITGADPLSFFEKAST